jgi:hypothetical protein
LPKNGGWNFKPGVMSMRPPSHRPSPPGEEEPSARCLVCCTTGVADWYTAEAVEGRRTPGRYRAIR